MKRTFRAAIVGTVFCTLSSLSLSAAAVTTSELEKRVSRLEKMAQNPVILQLLRRLETQENEVQELQDKMDRLQYQLKKLKAESDKRYQENDERISALEAQIQQLKQASPLDEQNSENGTRGGATEPEVSLTPKQPSTELPPAAVPAASSKPLPEKQPASDTQKLSTTQVNQPLQTHFPTPEEKAAYKAAFNLVKTAKYPEAYKAFEVFQKQYPHSKLSANAAYWQGEVALLQKDNAAALKAFDQVLTQYPHSLKVADAMLRKADTLVLMGKTEEGKKLYQQILHQFPQSRAAKSVKKRLQVLDQPVDEKKAK